jgi:hypothetical protein
VLGQGYHLGPVGSRLVAGVVLGALFADSTSYLNVSKGEWVPTLWKPNLDANTPTEMVSLLQLISSGPTTKVCSST